MYNLKNLLQKFKRFTIPMIIAFIISLICWYTLDLYHLEFNLKNIIVSFVYADYGAGAYYYHMMIQFIIIFPIIFTIIKKFDISGVISIGIVNFLYEYVTTSISLDSKIYRLLIFKFLSAIALGCYMHKHKDDKLNKVILIIMFLIGFMFIFAIAYLEYPVKVFVNSRGTSMLAVMYIFPIVYFLMQDFKEYTSHTKTGRCLEYIGKSSYHIMFSQLIFINLSSRFYHLIHVDVNNFNITLPLNIIISITMGCIWYYIENKVTHSTNKMTSKTTITQ